MNGKIIKTEFLIYLNKNLYKVVGSWEELSKVENEIMAKHKGFKQIDGSKDDFAVFANEETKEVFTYWYKMRETTNLKDSNGNIVCVGDKLIDNSIKRECWLEGFRENLYIRYDGFLTCNALPDIRDVSDLSQFTIIKRNPVI